MFNNSVLDVAIGLIFIYLLYSLLATTIKEFIATIFSYRGKMLERGIEQMLDGVNYKYFWWDRLMNWFDNKDGQKPGRKLALKKSLFTNKITSHELYKRAAENKTNGKPSYLAADNFSDILIDILKGTAGSTVLLKDIEQFVDENLTTYPGLQKILKIYLEQANGDLQRFKLLIENWYNDMMDRVSGWYKRQANRILIIIGLVLAVIFNVSTIEIVDKLSTDKTARASLVQNASEYVKKYSNSLPSTSSNIPPTNNPSKKIAKSKDSTDTTLKPAPTPVNTHSSDSSSSTKNDTTIQSIKEGLNKINQLYKDEIMQNDTIVGSGWGDYGYNESKEYGAWIKDGKPGNKVPEKPGFFDKIIFVLSQLLSWKKILGFIITAFAISLGAPFWFDLLNKFINLRVSGAKPDDKSTSTLVSKTALLNQKPDPTAKG